MRAWDWRPMVWSAWKRWREAASEFGRRGLIEPCQRAVDLQTSDGGSRCGSLPSTVVSTCVLYYLLQEEWNEFELEYATVLLPVCCGGTILLFGQVTWLLSCSVFLWVGLTRLYWWWTITTATTITHHTELVFIEVRYFMIMSYGTVWCCLLSFFSFLYYCHGGVRFDLHSAPLYAACLLQKKQTNQKK